MPTADELEDVVRLAVVGERLLQRGDADSIYAANSLSRLKTRAIKALREKYPETPLSYYTTLLKVVRLAVNS